MSSRSLLIAIIDLPVYQGFSATAENPAHDCAAAFSNPEMSLKVKFDSNGE
jgi:hypothetical protein